MVTAERAHEIKRRHSQNLFAKPGVVGVGVERDDAGNYILKISIERLDPELCKQLPDQIEGLPVKVDVTEPFRKRSEHQAL